MFRLGVVSDSHGDRAAIDLVCPLLKGMDAIAHLGDGMGDAKRILERTGLPLYAVSGNCDLTQDYPAERTEVFSGVKTLLTHGNHLKVKHSLLRLTLRAEEVGARARALRAHACAAGGLVPRRTAHKPRRADEWALRHHRIPGKRALPVPFKPVNRAPKIRRAAFGRERGSLREPEILWNFRAAH